MTKIVIEVKGGLIQNIYSDKRDVEVEVIDWDGCDSEDEAEEYEQIMEQVCKDSSYRMIY